MRSYRDLQSLQAKPLYSGKILNWWTMTNFRTNCKKCEKPLSWMVPTGGGDLNSDSLIDYREAQVLTNHSVICGACKTENNLRVDRVTLKVV